MLSHPRLANRKLVRARSRKTRSARRLRLDALEDRLAPATTLHWDGELAATISNNKWAATRTVLGQTHTNWIPEDVPHAGDTLIFDATAPAGARTTTNDLVGIAGLPFVVDSLNFGTDGYTLQGNPVYLNSPAGIAIDLGNGVSGKASIDLNVSFGVGQTWNVNAASNTTVAVDLNGSIGGAANLTTANSGLGNAFLGFFGNNGYTGTTTVGNRTNVVLGANNALGTTAGGTIVDPGGCLVLNGVNYTTAEPVTLRGGGGGWAILQIAVDNTTFAGPITSEIVDAGTLLPAIYSNSGLLATLTGEIRLNTGIHFEGPGDIQVSGVISGQGTLVKDDAGTLTLAGGAANTYSGTTFVNGGTLELKKAGGVNAVSGNLEVRTDGVAKLSANNQIADDVAVTVHGELRLTGFSETVGSLEGDGLVDLRNGNPLSPSNGTLTVGADNLSSTFDGVIQGAANNGGLVKTGTGTLTLTGANTYGGTTTVSGGILCIQNKQALGSAGGPPNNGTEVNDGATLELDLDPNNTSTLHTVSGETLTLNGSGVNGAGALVNLTGFNTWAGAPIILNTSSAIGVEDRSLTVTGNVQGAAASLLWKLGPGTLFFPTANTYLGPTVVANGVLNVSNSGALGGAGGDQIFGSESGTLQLSNGITVSNKPLTLTGTGFNGLGALESVSGTNTWAGNVSLAGNTSVAVDNGSTLILDHPISQYSGESGLTKIGTGTLKLSSTAPSTYSGPTKVDAGTLTAGVDNAVPIATALTVNTNATFDVNGNFVQVGSLAGQGTVKLTGSSFLRVGNDDTSTNFGGIISDSGQFQKIGAGTLTLTGNNTYTGFTSVTGGTLLIDGSQPNSPVSVSSGTLGGTGTTGPIGVSGGTLSPGDNGPDILTATGNVGIYSFSTFSVQLNGPTAGAGYDELNVIGTVVDLGNATLNATLGYTPAFGDSFTIINNDGNDPILNAFADLPEGAILTLGSKKLRVTYTGGDGNDVVLTVIPPSLSIDDVTVTEGDSGTVNAVFTVSLSFVSDTPLRVDFATADGTATAPGDYSATTGTLNIPAGSPSGTITVPVKGDHIDELDETFFVNLTNPVNAAIANAQGQGTITDDDTAGITVTPTSGLTTTEAGGTATFTVVLNSTPVADVTISLASSNTTEGTVFPPSLTFTTDNALTPRTVTVTGVDDTFDDGDIAYEIFTGAALSSDPNYSNRNPSDVSVTNVDDDISSIIVTPKTGLTTTEAGGQATFTVVLTSTPTADVTIALNSSDLSEGTISPASLTFTPSNAMTPQTVTVTGINDAVDDGDIAYSIVTAAAVSGDGNYNGLNAADVSLTNTDDDTVGILLSTSPSYVGVTTENGASETFFVVLGSEPTANVTLTLSVSNPAVVSINPSALTFTPADYALPHVVTVTGKDDGLVDGSQNYTIVTAPSVSADPTYDGIEAADIPFISGDILTANRGKFAEKDGDSYTVQLRGPGKIGFLQRGDSGGIERIHLSETDPARSSLVVTVKKAVGTNALVAIDEITGTGLKSTTARASDLVGRGIDLTGPLGGLTIHDILNRADVRAGASSTLRTRIRAHVIGDGTTITLNTAVSSLTAASFGDGAITAPSIGMLRVTGDFTADVTVTGPGGLSRANISGAASDSVFRVLAGSVGSFRAGAFINSELLVGFTPNDSADPLAGGTFAPELAIGSFQVTRSPTPAFVNSVVAAATIKRTRLATAQTNNGAARFGLIGHNFGSVRIVEPAFNFGATATSLGDFHVVVA